jgi:hypothetical protein
MFVASAAGLDDHSADVLNVPQSGQESREQQGTSAFLLLVSSDLGDDERAADRESRDDICGLNPAGWGLVVVVQEVAAGQH